MREVIKKILNTAVWAPSGDNSQPWRFEVRDRIIDVFCLPEKDNPIFNYRNRGTYLANGALIENIVIAASHEGYATEVKIFPDSANPKHIAQIELTSSDPKAEPLYNYILKRASNRKFYQKNKTLSLEQKNTLLQASAAFAEVKTVFIEEKKPCLKLARQSVKMR